MNDLSLQKNSSIDFYNKIPTFDRFSDLMDDGNYKPVPDDWIVVLTDIQGSTKAIAENRYKDVNLLGAASITAVLNRLKGFNVPFVFGGDGATILVHESHLSHIIPALEATRRLGRESFSLEIRIGIVPVKEVYARGGVIEVARYAASPKATFAMIRGGGITIAEKLVKAQGSENSFLMPDRSSLDPEYLKTAFEGLSCRWNPVKAKRGEMLSLLVMATKGDKNQTYRDVVAKINGVLNAESNPITFEKIDRSFNPKNFVKDVQVHAVGQGILGKWFRFLQAFYQASVMGILLRLKASIGDFSAEGYLRDLAANSDTQKFDDVLRMVRDCSTNERNAIEQYLKSERAAGRLCYGLQSSNVAMLTCLVFQLDNHVHFIDGGDGGYALASRQLKEQLLA